MHTGTRVVLVPVGNPGTTIDSWESRNYSMLVGDQPECISINSKLGWFRWDSYD